MKKIYRVLLFIFILPLCISFSACKKKKNETDNSNQSQIEQPKPEEDPDDDYESNVETYSVSFDYNLPEEYDFLLSNRDFTIRYKEVGTNTSLANVPDIKLQKHFLGWCEEGSDVVIEGSVTSDTSKTISLKGKWNEETLRKYYYSDGLTIDVINGEASIYSYTGSAETVILPEVFTMDEVDYELTEIQANVFSGKNIQKLIVNADSLTIGQSAFKNSNISSLDFSKVITIANNAFENTSFVNLCLDESMLSIGEAAFKNCKKLVSVDFDGCNMQIVDNMFYGCEKLSNITNANNITKVGSYAFAECYGLTNTDFLGPRVKTLEEYAFQNCVNLVSVTLPETLNNVFDAVFDGCDAITELRLGKTFENRNNETRSDNLLNHVGSIGENVTKITLIGNSIKQLSQNYFDGFTKLETFIMVDSVEIVESYTFRQCVNLKNITLSNNLDTNNFSYMAFYGTKFLNERTDLLIYKNEIMYVPANISPIYEFPQDVYVTRINDNAFAGNTNLKEITIPVSVMSMGVGVFQNCVNLEKVVFEENEDITEINSNTFYGCKKLSSVNLDALPNLTKLGDNSFRNTAISNFVIPASVTDIGDAAFLYSKVESFAIDGVSTKFAVEDGVLYEFGDGEKILLNYPVYKAGEMFVCPSDVTSVAPYAFSNVSNLKYVYFSNKVEWLTTVLSGKEVCQSFAGSSGVMLFAEKESFECAEVLNIARLSTDGVIYDFESNTLSLTEDFSTSSTIVYIKKINPETNKVNLVCFAVEISGEEDAKVYTFVEDSLFILDVQV